MQFVYIVVENGEAYSYAYKAYKDAVTSVKDKYKKYLEEMIKDVGDLNDIEKILADINVPENPACKTHLYIEKGINIEIYKLPVL